MVLEVYPEYTLVIYTNDDKLSTHYIPLFIKKIAFVGDRVINIADNFNNFANHFLGYSYHTSVDLSGLRNLTTIGDYFLKECSELTHIDLSNLNNLKTIGRSFLRRCVGLTHIDFSSLKSMRIIDHNFLKGCKNLTNVNLSGFVNVTVIGDSFLQNCINLNHIDLSSFRNLITIGDYFLSDCIRLTAVDLSEFLNVKTMGCGFLAIDEYSYATKTSLLRLVNFSGLKKLEKWNGLLLKSILGNVHAPNIRLIIDNVSDAVYYKIRSGLYFLLKPLLCRDNMFISPAGTRYALTTENETLLRERYVSNYRQDLYERTRHRGGP